MYKRLYVQILRKGFYHIEVDMVKYVDEMLKVKMISLRDVACFLPWKPGFDPIRDFEFGPWLVPISFVFLRFPKDYMFVLPSMVAQIDTYV